MFEIYFESPKSSIKILFQRSYLKHEVFEEKNMQQNCLNKKLSGKYSTYLLRALKSSLHSFNGRGPYL